MGQNDWHHAPWDRRGLLRAGAATLVAACVPGAAHAVPLPRIKPQPDALQRPTAKSLNFLNLHTGERLQATYWKDGHYIDGACAEIDKVLRDFRTDEITPIDRSLLDLLHALHRHLDADAPYHVISGYRSRRTNATLAANSGGVAKKSLHMRGMAIDIRLPGRELADVRRAARAMKRGGVGYYPASDFVHLDVGRVRFW